MLNQTAIVVVTYNAKRWLAVSLGSCAKYAAGVPVYAVDNNSRDNTAELIKLEYPTVKLIRQGENFGFARGNNIGIKRALADGAEYIFLLNQDAELTAGALAGLVEYLQQNPTAAAVQPVILLPNGLVNSIGNSFHYLGLGEAVGNGQDLDAAWQKFYGHNTNPEPPYFSGAAVLLRAAALRQAGLFDEDLFMYHEDLELSLRLRAAGWKLGITRQTAVIHHYEPRRSKTQMYFMERNRYLVWLSYFKPATLALLFLPAAAAELAIILGAGRGGWLGAKIRALEYLFRPAARNYIINKRPALKKLMAVKDRDLLRWAAGELQWQEESLFMKVFNYLSASGWRIIFPIIRW